MPGQKLTHSLVEMWVKMERKESFKVFFWIFSENVSFGRKQDSIMLQTNPEISWPPQSSYGLKSSRMRDLALWTCTL